MLTIVDSDASGRCGLQLNHESMVRFNESFSKMWVRWVNESPWANDDFLKNRTPVGVTIRYGQNVPISLSSERDSVRMERNQWDEQRRWENLRFVTFALATHIT